MQFQVPQFIETEDKIVGPLSLRQFLYVGGAAGMSLFLYFILNTFVWILISVILIAAGAGLALIKVNGQSLGRVIFSAALFYWRPQTYVWQPENAALPKNESTLRSIVGSGFSLESILAGIALRNAREEVQLGSKTSSAGRAQKKVKERFEIIERLSGDRRAARRIDYR